MPMETGTPVEQVNAEAARKIYENVRYLSAEEFSTTPVPSSEGLTVLYGNGLEDLVDDFAVYPEKDGAPPIADLIPSDGSSRMTYMVLRFQRGDAVDLHYVGVSFEENVPAETVERFVEQQLTDEAMDGEIVSFVNRLISDGYSAYRRYDEATLMSQEGGVCARVSDTVTHIALYGDASPVVVFRQNLSCDAYFVPDLIAHSDRYVLRTRVTVTPGNGLSVPDGFCNREYGKKIAIRGVRTSFYNIHAQEGDYYISLTPFGNADDVSGKFFTCSEELFSFNSPDKRTKIAQNAHFGISHDSFVEFLADGDGRIASSPFRHAAQMYMESGGDTLLTRFSAGVTYRLNGEDRFVESKRDIFFDKN